MDGPYPPQAVFINVYDIVWANILLQPLGLGIHHSGVEVYGQEWAYGRCANGSGVGSLPPKTYPNHIFRESIFVGVTNHSPEDVATKLSEIRTKWLGADYHITTRNCNHFASILVAELIVARSNEIFPFYKNGQALVPCWINRISNLLTSGLPASLVQKVDETDRKMQGLYLWFRPNGSRRRKIF